MKPALSIIYVYYNTPLEIQESINSLKNALGTISYEIIIVDNASSKKIPQKVQLKNVTIIRNLKNYGYGKGLNIGASKASGKYLLLVNPDVIFNNNSIIYMLRRIEKDSSIGVIGPQLLDMKGQVLQSISRMPYLPSALINFSFISKIWPNNPSINRYNNRNLDRNKEQTVDVVGGACMLVRKSSFDQINGYDESFFMYFEEADFCFRIKNSGYKIIYYPQAKVTHLIGKSSQDKEMIENNFEQSRFKFFKKYHGLFPAIFGEFLLRLFKPLSLLLIAILGISAYLNFYKIGERMIFIGDQGWFYMSALNMLLDKNIPLVGITASHTWLHQGPFWTYILAFILWISRFNPVSGGYFTAILGVFTTFFVYEFGKQMFSKRVGLISALLYATSPIVIISSQMPYHTSPIPLLTLFLIYFVYRWIKSGASFFPMIIFFLGLLYNFELATQVLWFSVGLIFILGYIFDKAWAKGILNVKTIIFSILLFILPMIPVIIYDISHNFAQTIKFFAWIFYRIISQLFGVKRGLSMVGLSKSVILMLSFFWSNYIKLIFAASPAISLIILIICAVYYGYYLIPNVKKDIFSSINILAIFITIPLIGIFINMTPSDAYTPLFFSSIIIFTGWVLDSLMFEKYLFFQILGLVLLIAVVNVLFILDVSWSKSLYGLNFSTRLETVKTIIKDTGNNSYSIKGEGPGSNFESFTMNYEYLAWYLGDPVSIKSEKNLYFIRENKYDISIHKEVLKK